MKRPVNLRWFFLTKLPSAYFSGVRIKEIDETKCEVTVPFKWFTKNPFRSTYFACLSMAAEMSSGALCMLHLYQRKPAVSFLVIKMEAAYFKKATGKTTFICTQGNEILKSIEESVRSGDPRTIQVKAAGFNEKNEVVAEFFVTWSFKVKERIN